MTDEEKRQFLDTLIRMGRLAAKLPEICPEVFLSLLLYRILMFVFQCIAAVG